MNNIVLRSIQMQWKNLKMSILLLTMMVFSNAVLAIEIAQSPLFIDKSATPNVMFVLDDSGSMDWDILTVPHWRAQNYDHDIMRYWARGGWLGWDETPTSTRVVDGSWISYSGYCHDRNADGICYNELYLNDDGDRDDAELAIITSTVPSTRSYRLRLYHVYHWNWTGKCVAPPNPPNPPSGGADANKYLPSLDNVLAFITGTGQAQAHEYIGYRWNWTSIDNNAQPVAIIPHPNRQNTDNSAYGTREYWRRSGSDTTIPAPGDAAAAVACLAQGSGYTWDADGLRQLVHTGSTPWSAAGSLTVNTSVEPRTYTYRDSFGTIKYSGLTGAKWIYQTDNSTLGDYHWEYIEPIGHDELPPVAGLDINGDGDGNDTSFKEKDNQTSRVIKYRYIQHLTDNTYPRSDWRACGNTSSMNVNTNVFYTAANRCPRPNNQMPGNYIVASPNNPVNNPSNKVANSQYNIGKLDFIQLGNPAVVPRYIRSTTWVGAPRTPNSDVLMPTWAADTKHGMSKHDSFPLIVDWRPRSSDFNAMYYSPKSNYKVWPGITETLPSGCSNKFNCARSNPQTGTSGYNLTTDLARPRQEYGAVGVPPVSVQAGFVYEIWVDDAGHLPSRSRPEWNRGDTSCGTTGGYTITAADVAASFGGAGVVDPATGIIYGAGEHICFSYLNKDPSGNAGDGEIDLWDSHYRVEVKDSGIVVQKVRRTPHLKGEQLYSATGPGGTPPVYNVGSHHYSSGPAGYAAMRVAMSDTRVLSTVTYDPANYASYATSALCLKVLGEDPSNPGQCRTLAQVKENAANWYQYSRKRSFVAKGAIANLIAEIPDVNYGLMGTKKHNSNNISALFKDVFDGNGSGNGNADRTVHNDNIRSSLYSYVWPATGTPLRLALERAGEYFAGRGPNIGPGVNNHSVSPITESCQKNYAIMLTDGYWNGGAPLNVNNEDGDAYSGILADVAKKYYDEDLRPLLANDVPTDGFDTNNQQHLTTIGIGFGVSGSLVDDPNPLVAPSEDGWPGDPDASGAPVLTESSTWGGNPDSTALVNQQYKIDDLWHAAYNSRGQYYQADNPEQLILQLKAAILTALATAGSGSALSTNTNVLTASTRVYQTLFTSGEWTGDVKSFSFTAAGLVNSTPEWSAQPLLDGVASGSRKIFTLDVSDAGIPFRWASLSAPSQQDLLRTRWSDSSIQSAAFGQAQLDYIRGQSDPQFRPRSHKLGDIVHSEPLYVGTPRGLYADADYLSFKVAQQALNSGSGRTPLIFVGANDGMLHAFDAATGAEKYAYIPKVLLSEINALSHKPNTGQDFVHRYYVDQTPVSGDVKIISNWKTVLVGGLGAGGQGVYALDITTVPSSATNETAIAGAKAMWEFTTADDIDMGYSFSKPSIVRLNDGSFAAIFGNGYNSTNHKAVLYVVDIADGSIIKKFETAVGNSGNQNGMSTPTVVDIDGDLKADRIYAGDFLGNVWTIDISDSSTLNWKFSYNTLADSNNSSLAKTPLFTATDGSGTAQPITSTIAISEHPLGALAGYILNFGTGKYLGTSDNTDIGQTTQTMYGVWDAGVAGVTRSNLVQQTIDKELVNSTTNTAIRVTSANGPVNWMQAGHNVGDSGWEVYTDQKGWRMDLVNIDGGNTDNKGERVVTKMAVRNGAIILSTLLPAASPCDGGGSGWLMTLNASTGARFSDSPFDVNGDGLFNVNDFADIDGDGTGDTAVSGVKSSSGIPSIPTILHRPGGSSIALTDNSSGTLSTDNGTALAGSFGGPTVSSNTCSVVGGTGSCGMLPNGTCQMTGGSGSCVVNGSCPGACGLNGFSEIGRQSWIQLE